VGCQEEAQEGVSMGSPRHGEWTSGEEAKISLREPTARGRHSLRHHINEEETLMNHDSSRTSHMGGNRHAIGHGIVENARGWEVYAIGASNQISPCRFHQGSSHGCAFQEMSDHCHSQALSSSIEMTGGRKQSDEMSVSDTAGKLFCSPGALITSPDASTDRLSDCTTYGSFRVGSPGCQNSSNDSEQIVLPDKNVADVHQKMRWVSSTPCQRTFIAPETRPSALAQENSHAMYHQGVTLLQGASSSSATGATQPALASCDDYANDNFSNESSSSHGTQANDGEEVLERRKRNINLRDGMDDRTRRRHPGTQSKALHILGERILGAGRQHALAQSLEAGESLATLARRSGYARHAEQHGHGRQEPVHQESDSFEATTASNTNCLGEIVSRAQHGAEQQVSVGACTTPASDNSDCEFTTSGSIRGWPHKDTERHDRKIMHVLEARKCPRIGSGDSVAASTSHDASTSRDYKSDDRQRTDSDRSSIHCVPGDASESGTIHDNTHGMALTNPRSSHGLSIASNEAGQTPGNTLRPAESTRGNERCVDHGASAPLFRHEPHHRREARRGSAPTVAATMRGWRPDLMPMQSAPVSDLSEFMNLDHSSSEHSSSEQAIRRSRKPIFNIGSTVRVMKPGPHYGHHGTIVESRCGYWLVDLNGTCIIYARGTMLDDASSNERSEKNIFSKAEVTLAEETNPALLGRPSTAPANADTGPWSNKGGNDNDVDAAPRDKQREPSFACQFCGRSHANRGALANHERHCGTKTTTPTDFLPSQCLRNPLCVRGYHHMGLGGPCRIRKPEGQIPSHNGLLQSNVSTSAECADGYDDSISTLKRDLGNGGSKDAFSQPGCVSFAPHQGRDEVHLLHRYQAQVPMRGQRIEAFLPDNGTWVTAQVIDIAADGRRYIIQYDETNIMRECVAGREPWRALQHSAGVQDSQSHNSSGFLSGSLVGISQGGPSGQHSHVGSEDSVSLQHPTQAIESRAKNRAACDLASMGLFLSQDRKYSKTMKLPIDVDAHIVISDMRAESMNVEVKLTGVNMDPKTWRNRMITDMWLGVHPVDEKLELGCAAICRRIDPLSRALRVDAFDLRNVPKGKLFFALYCDSECVACSSKWALVDGEFVDAEEGADGRLPCDEEVGKATSKPSSLSSSGH